MIDTNEHIRSKCVFDGCLLIFLSGIVLLFRFYKLMRLHFFYSPLFFYLSLNCFAICLYSNVIIKLKLASFIKITDFHEKLGEKSKIAKSVQQSEILKL
jgi:hypothetical protein